jgi:cell surface protein SprA
VESFKTRIRHVVPTAILTFGISVSAWALLDILPKGSVRVHAGGLPSREVFPIRYGYSQSQLSAGMGVGQLQIYLDNADACSHADPITKVSFLVFGDAVSPHQSTTNKDKASSDSLSRSKENSLLPQKKDSLETRPVDKSNRSKSSNSATDRLGIDTSSVMKDSLSAKSDTSSSVNNGASDTLHLADWLSKLRYQHPQADIFPEYRYPLFLYSNAVQQSATFDSTGDFVNIRETIFGKDIRIPLQVPTAEYIKLEEHYLIQKTWADMAHAYTSSTQQNALGSLMSGVTNIDIPIPSNPVLSIFGPPRINLRISGAVDIHGAWQNQKTNAQTLSSLGNVTNQPDFKQDVQINVNGTVGDKLSIGANWDTQNQFDYENQLKIKYTGYDDEIIKSVEAGNVSMSSNSSFIGSSQALFGIKTEAQFGPLTLTGLASQQKAQSKTLSVSGGSSNQSFQIRAYQYSTNHFFIDTTYREFYEKDLQSNMTLYSSPSLRIGQIEVWQYTQSAQQPPNARDGVAIMDLPPFNTSSSFYDSLRSLPSITNTQSGLVETGKFIKLTTDQYSIDLNTGVLTLNNPPQPGSIIAVAYQTQDGTTYGTLSSNDTSAAKLRLVLKLVKPAYLLPSETEAWLMQLRNIYPVGATNLSRNSLSNVKILYTPPGQSPQDNIAGINLLELFGVDKTGENGQGGPPDGAFDNNSVCVNYSSGEIIFPFLQPFVEAFNQTSVVTQNGTQEIPASDSLPSYAFAAVYDTTADQASNDQLHDRFTITGNITGAISSHYNLGFNLVQGSVKVLLNGTPLIPDQDYTVDYVTGEVDIRNAAALVPGANVQIQYETNDIFQIASKSLVGLRGNLKVNDQTNLGFTLMNYSIQSPNDKVQLGEEPMNNLIMGIDGATSLNLPFLTKALDALPLINTAAPSKLNLHAEAAYMIPNPNTRTSIIPDDKGQGIAYIDDFEGSRRTIPLPVQFTGWTIASIPALTALDSVYPGIPDSVKNDWRGWTYWYNVTPPITRAQDIWPQKQLPPDQQQQTVLSIGFIDTVRGQFNRAYEHESDLAAYQSQYGKRSVLDSTIRKTPQLAWGGLMNVLSGNATDLAGQNINYIEIWMKIDKAPGKGTMHVDIGQLSEDVFGNGILMTEDSAGLGTLQPGHDFGLDEAFDSQEQQEFPWIPRRSIDDPTKPVDPDGDDYSAIITNNPATSDYTHVNGTEGNSNTVNGKFPDTEDLLHNGNLSTINNYFEYNVKLDTVRNPYIVGGGSNGWYQYIIPLKDPSKSVGSPSLSSVQFVRLWFDGMSAGEMRIDIAQMDLLGNYWQVPNVNDSTMQVSTVDVFDNTAQGYQAPVNGLQPIDHTNPEQPIQLNESSLDLIVNRLHGGDSRYAYKTFPNTLNVFHYKTMKFFVHGDPSWNYTDSTHHDADVYIRFGSDSSNFYEYRQPINPHPINTGLNPGWQDITIEFSKLAAIKETRDSLNQPFTPRVPADNGVPGATYWIQGNPSLMRVTYFQIGIANPNPGSAKLLSGSVWVDELRLTNVDNTHGGAYRFDGGVQFADIGQISFNFSRTDPYFHDLTTQFGTLNTQQNWSINGSLSLDKLFPREWQGTSIPFTYSHTESFGNPLYLAGSDILITSAIERQQQNLIQKGYSPTQAAAMADSLRTSSQTLSIANSWAIPTMKIAVPSTKWYIRDIINNITMGYSWSGSNYRNTQVKMGNSWSWNYTAAYSVQFDPNAYFTPFPSRSKNLTLSQPSQNFAREPVQPPSMGNDFQIRYLPNSISFSMSAQRSLITEDYWTQRTERITPNFTATRSGGINWRLTNNGILNPTIDYRFNINSSLLYIDYDTSTGKPYPNSYVFHQIFLNNGLINFGTDYAYSQQFQLTTQPKLPLKIQQYLDMQGSYSSAYQWNNSLQQAQFGKSSGVSSTLSLGSNLRLKMLTDLWFAGGTSTAAPDTNRNIAQPPVFNPRGRGHGREEFEYMDTTATISAQSSGINKIGNLLGVLIKVPFLDFENISLNFTSTNTSQNGGLPSSRPGMSNFFRVPFIQESNPALGPSQLYQLGLISDPYSKINFVRRNGFPFFGVEKSPTVRVPNAGITDNFTNSNTLDLRTSRNLWQGARIDLSWHVAWSYNRNSTYTTDSRGNPIDSTMTTMVTGQVTKSFFTIPPILFFSVFKSGINQVATDYAKMKNDPSDTRTDQQKLSDAFVKGFETLPILDKIFGQYMPRLNYSFHWDGLEQFPLFKSFATHVSLDHAYQSTYSQSWHIASGQQTSGPITDAQTISYGFQPLVGLNITFKNVGDASISSSVQYNTNSQYSLSPSSYTIAQQTTNQLSITANYAKRGFSLPLFGLKLQNDVDISASYSSALSSQYSYSTSNLGAGASPINGTNQTTLEIRFQYSLSQRVTASIYYRNNKVTPITPGSPIPGTTTNEAGVDVHVSIAG